MSYFACVVDKKTTIYIELSLIDLEHAEVSKCRFATGFATGFAIGFGVCYWLCHVDSRTREAALTAPSDGVWEPRGDVSH